MSAVSPLPTPHSVAPWRTGLGLLLLGSPLVLYLAFLGAHAINVPTGDDYFAIFDFLRLWHDPAHPGGLRFLFEQFYSHRQPFQRLEAVGLTYLAGHCDLRYCVAVAWIGWGLLLASLLRGRWSAGATVGWLLPVPLLLMQPQGQNNVLVATGSPGHAWTLLLAFWACELSRSASAGRQAGAMLLAAASALCTANGLLLFPIVALRDFFRLDWARGCAWLAAGAVAWGWYLWGYSVAEQPFAHHAFSAWSFLANAAVMTGAIVHFGSMGVGPVMALGLAILLVAGLTTWMERRDERPLVGGCLFLFLLLSIAMTSYARIGWEPGYMLQDRYRPYGLVLAALLYLHYAGRLTPSRRNILAAIAVPAALGFNLLSYAQEYPQVLFGRRWAEATAMNLAFDRAVPAMPSAPEQAAAAGDILLAAVQRGDLRPPSLLQPDDVRLIRSLAAASALPSGPAWNCKESGDVSGFVLQPADGAAPGPVPAFGVLLQGDQPLLLPVLQPKSRIADLLTRFRILGPGYQFVLPGGAYRAGRHRLCAMARQANGELTVLWSTLVTCP